MTKRALIIGSNSDIAKGLMPMLEADGYELQTYKRPESPYNFCQQVLGNAPWDLLICTIGAIEPVGNWWEVDSDDWSWSVHCNLEAPFSWVQSLWPNHAKGATVCFFAGSNPNMIMPGYSAYNVGKMALLKLVEQLDFETPDATFFALGPGIVLTKIHKASAGWDNPKLRAAREAGKSTPIRDIYDCLMWCEGQSKEVIGGRNICVSDWKNNDPWRLMTVLEQRPDLYKLRRVE